MGEGPKDLRDDAGRFDAPRRDDVMGRGEPDLVGRSMETGVVPPAPVPAYPAAPPPGDTAQSSGSTGSATPETAEIRAEIEHRRANISETIDEIQQRLSPGNIVTQATDNLKEATRTGMRRVASSAGDTATQVAGSTRELADTVAIRAREHPWSAGALLVGIGAAAWWMMSRRSSDLEEEWDVDDYSEESLYFDDDIVERRGNRAVNLVRDNPVPIALATIGLGWWMWNQRAGSRSEYEYGRSFDDVESGTGYGAAGADAGAYRTFDSERGVWVGGESEGATDRVKDAVSNATDRARDAAARAGGRAREAMASASGRARHAVSDVGGRTREIAGRAQRQIGHAGKRAGTQLQHWMEHNPLAVGAVAMAVGAAVGMALPETRREQQLMGDARERVVERGKAMAQDAVDRAKQAAQHVVETAKSAAEGTEGAANTASGAIDRAAESAKSTIDRV
jgi:ElaB/YqjD/DUF883 family membrane-anchored ribosome-binding protein